MVVRWDVVRWDPAIVGTGCMMVLFVLAFQPAMTWGQKGPSGSSLESIAYPPTRRSDQVDNYHGRQVADPYRWLEDVDSPETKAWVAAQNKLTFSHLEAIPGRQAIEDRLTKLWNYERFGLPEKHGGRYFFTRNNGLQNQSVLYVADSLDAQPRVLIDPNPWAEDGTMALAGWVPSDNGKYLAYGIAAAGSDWREWKILEVDTGRELPDRVRWVKFSGVSWTPDSQGIYYSRYDEPKSGEEFTGTNYYQKLYYHRLGDDQAKDKLVYQRADEKEWGFDGRVTEDGKYLIISVWRGTEEKNQIFYQSLDSESSSVIELIAGFDAEYQFIANQGSTFWIATDLDAPMRRVIAVNLNHPEREHWREVIPEQKEVLREVSVVGNRFFANYLKDARSQVRMFDLTGKSLGEVSLPGIGSVVGFGGKAQDAETFFSFTNYTNPGGIYRFEIATETATVFRTPQVAFDPAEYVTEQAFYESKDGTRIPMFISYKRGLKRDGSHPTILYGYGGFNIAITPSFSVSNLVWMEQGGVYAVANLRGGSEYGRSWHEAGMKSNKQNVFDDFIAAAQWLIDQRYTRREKLAIEGRSNGGLLVGAAMTQRPDLFGAALPGVGVMDMLRYHKFTIGWAWVSEYGSSDDPDEFETLLAYSPYHNLRTGTHYPATLVTTADHDDRVVPGHSFKFAAALQHAHQGPHPVMIRIETSAGHGAGTPTSKRIEAAADVLAFLNKALGEVE